ncbi:hypothetical protein [Natronococcus sp.]|uniref:hypothetical protein n=1 Tax=Natronococcus sp. TaxID=35747 RepID=UPI003A4E3E66
MLFATAAILETVLGLSGAGGGDAPLWSITLAFAAISLAAATVGYVVGIAIRFVLPAVRRRRAERPGSECEYPQ